MARLSGHSSQNAIYGVSIAFTVLSGVVVLARLLTRFLVARQAGLDDAFISIAFIFSLTMGIAICNQAFYGMGVHIWTVLPEKIEWMSIWFWAFVWLYYAGLFFTKLSIILQYLRIFPQERFRKTCFITMGVITVWGFWSVFSAIFMCRPVSHFWHSISLTDPQCLPRLNTWYANAAVNIVTDFVTVVLPLPMIKSLEIPKKQKVLLLGIFGLGFITCIISILRLVFIYPISSSPDMTWNTPLANIWSSVELNVGILCSCAPTLKGAIQKGFPKLLESLGSLRSTRKGSADTGASSDTQDTVEKIKIEMSRKDKPRITSFFKAAMLSNKSSQKSLTRSRDYDEEEGIGYDTTSRRSIDGGIEVITVVDQVTEIIPNTEEGVARANSGRWVPPEGPTTTVSSALGSHGADPNGTHIPVDQRLFQALGVPGR